MVIHEHVLGRELSRAETTVTALAFDLAADVPDFKGDTEGVLLLRLGLVPVPVRALVREVTLARDARVMSVFWRTGGVW